MKIKTTNQKVPIELIERIDRIRVGKIRNGSANCLISRRRMFAAINNLPNLEDVLLKASIKDDRK